MTNVWAYRPDVAPPIDVGGFRVRASDGQIGRVDGIDTDVGRACLVVEIGRWIFRRKRMVPAMVVQRIDASARTVFVSMSRGQIKEGPPWRERWWLHPARRVYDEYFAPYGW